MVNLSRRPWAAPAFVALVVLLVGWGGLLPGVGFWDTGEFQAVLPVLGTAHPTGYPTYTILGYLANIVLTPLGEPAFRMSVLSLLCVATAAALATRLTARLGAGPIISIAVGLAFAATPVAWQNATRADPHTLHVALIVAVFLLLAAWEDARRAGDPRADRRLVIAAFMYGLAVGNHSLTLLLAAPIGLYVLAVEPRIVLRPGFILRCAAVLAVTVVVVYLELPLRAGPFRAPLVYARPETWDGFWYIVLAEQFRTSLVDPLSNLGHKLGELASIAAAQYGALAPLVPVAFLATLRARPRFALLTGLATAITALFAQSYVNAAIDRYYLVPLLVGWVWLGVLAATVVAQVGERAADSRDTIEDDAPVAAAAGATGWRTVVPALIVTVVLLVPTAYGFSDRQAAADRSGDRSAATWLDAVLRELEPDAVIVSWWSVSTPLWYAQAVEGRRTDVLVLDDRTRIDMELGEVPDAIERYLGQRPVYVVQLGQAPIDRLRSRYLLTPLASPEARNVYEVTGRVGGGG